jgi:hypothetical protein
MLMISGALATFFSVQFLMKVQILSPPMNFIALAIMGFIAIANIVCGLLLLASE